MMGINAIGLFLTTLLHSKTTDADGQNYNNSCNSVMKSRDTTNVELWGQTKHTESDGV